MGKKSGGDGGAGQARADEQERQAEIRKGTSTINSIFDGGQRGVNAYGADAAYDPNATYYNIDGSAWTPKEWTGSAPRGEDETDLEAQNRLEHDRVAYLGPQFQKALKSGLYSEVAGPAGQFTDDFFNKRQQAYIDYATPQLDQQYADAQKQLTFALARSGNSDSSARSSKLGELQRLYDTNKQQVADQALSYSSNARNAVEDARGNLIQTLNTTGDATGAANSALARASALSQPDTYSPLGQLFGAFTGALGTQAALERASAYSGGAVQPRYNTGLFGNNPNAVSVTGG